MAPKAPAKAKALKVPDKKNAKTIAKTKAVGGKQPPGKGKPGAAGKGGKKDKKGKKGKKGKRRKGKKKKKQPRCPIKRRKKAIKRACRDMLDKTALLNSYYTMHGATDMLKFRKFKWSKKKKKK